MRGAFMIACLQVLLAGTKQGMGKRARQATQLWEIGYTWVANPSTYRLQASTEVWLSCLLALRIPLQ